ncbi:MAG: replication protein [Desulfobacterales bacterium]|nr:replication protein [Desulfobacterales bacterium]
MPHVRNGHTWIANELIEQVFAKGKFSKRESQIIWIILRESWGWLDKRPKTVKRYGKEIRKYSITHQPISYTQFSEKTGIAMPHIGETIRSLKAKKAIREHHGYYKFNKNYDSYQNSNQSYQNGNQGKQVTEIVTKSYRNSNPRLPKRELKVTEIVTSTASKGKPKKNQRNPKESKERLNKERNMILSQINNLLSQFPSDIKEMVDEYVENAKLENKTERISLQKRRRLINELYSVWSSCNDPVLQEDFRKALRVTNNKQVPNVNYVTKVMRGIVNKRALRIKGNGHT